VRKPKKRQEKLKVVKEEAPKPNVGLLSVHKPKIPFTVRRNKRELMVKRLFPVDNSLVEPTQLQPSATQPLLKSLYRPPNSVRSMSPTLASHDSFTKTALPINHVTIFDSNNISTNFYNHVEELPDVSRLRADLKGAFKSPEVQRPKKLLFSPIRKSSHKLHNLSSIFRARHEASRKPSASQLSRVRSEANASSKFEIPPNQIKREQLERLTSEDSSFTCYNFSKKISQRHVRRKIVEGTFR
jgi:hypothetical protein